MISAGAGQVQGRGGTRVQPGDECRAGSRKAGMGREIDPRELRANSLLAVRLEMKRLEGSVVRFAVGF